MTPTFTLIATAFTILGLLASAVAYFEVTRRRHTAETLRENNKDLTDRVDILEDKNAALEKDLATAKGTILVLRETVTQAAAVNALQERTNANHQEIMALLVSNHSEVMKALGALAR